MAPGEAPTPEKANTTGTEAPSTSSAEVAELDSTTGTIQAARILPTDTTRTFTRPSGDTVEIPEVRKTNDPELFAESILINMAAAGTTNSEAEQKDILQSFMENETQQQGVIDMFAHVKSKVEGSDTNKGYHISVFDNPKSPAKFTVINNGTRISFSGGDLYLSPYMSSSGKVVPWQGSETHRTDYTYAYKVSEFSVSVQKDSSGNFVPVDAYLDIDR